MARNIEQLKKQYNTVSHGETDGIGSVQCDSYNGKFIGKTETECNAVDTVAQVTLTTKAYKTAVLRAFEAVIIFEGGNS